MSRFRNRLMGGIEVERPYDARVEYLESTGTQYIDTGIECTGDLCVEFEGRVNANVNQGALGSVISTSSGYFRHHWSPYKNGNNFYWIQNDGYNYSSVPLNWSYGVWYKVSIDPVNGIASIDGNTVTFTPLSGSLTTGENYFIFARSGLGTIQHRSCAFKYLKLSRGGVLLRSFIPVRVGNVGYMYDRVSGELFGNLGTGSFILGG